MTKINTFFIFLVLVISVLFSVVYFDKMNKIQEDYVKTANKNYEILKTMELLKDESLNQKREVVDKKDLNLWLQKHEKCYINVAMPYYLNEKELEGYVVFYQENIDKNIIVDKIAIYSKDNNVLFIISISVLLCFIVVVCLFCFLKFILERKNGTTTSR